MSGICTVTSGDIVLTYTTLSPTFYVTGATYNQILAQHNSKLYCSVPSCKKFAFQNAMQFLYCSEIALAAG